MYRRTILDNGLRVLTAEMRHTHSVAMFIAIGAGSRYEPDALAGLSHFLEHLPFKGTRGWPSALAVSEAVEGVGGIMNAATEREMTSFWCKVASVHADRALPVLLDLITHPLLDAAEMWQSPDTWQGLPDSDNQSQAVLLSSDPITEWLVDPSEDLDGMSVSEVEGYLRDALRGNPVLNRLSKQVIGRKARATGLWTVGRESSQRNAPSIFRRISA